MKKIILILSCFTILFTSCLQKFALNRMGVFDKSLALKYITNNKKQIVFLPMHHIGTKEFYSEEARITDSLLKQGYTIFYEGVDKGDVTDPQNFDTLSLKFRKILGYHKSKNDNGFIDTINNTILGKKTKLISKYKLTNQDIFYYKKQNNPKIINIDGNIDVIIPMYEQKYGIINLYTTDFSTKLGEIYNAKSSRSQRNYFMLETRNIIISKAVLNSSISKILLVYGKAHYEGILDKLIQEDSTFKEAANF